MSRINTAADAHDIRAQMAVTGAFNLLAETVLEWVENRLAAGECPMSTAHRLQDIGAHMLIDSGMTSVSLQGTIGRGPTMYAALWNWADNQRTALGLTAGTPA